MWIPNDAKIGLETLKFNSRMMNGWQHNKSFIFKRLLFSSKENTPAKLLEEILVPWIQEAGGSESKNQDPSQKVAVRILCRPKICNEETILSTDLVHVSLSYVLHECVVLL